MFHYETDELLRGVMGRETTQNEIAMQGHKCRICELWGKKKNIEKRTENTIH